MARGLCGRPKILIEMGGHFVMTGIMQTELFDERNCVAIGLASGVWRRPMSPGATSEVFDQVPKKSRDYVVCLVNDPRERPCSRRTVKFSRQNSIHVSPTVLWDGLVAGDISSS